MELFDFNYTSRHFTSCPIVINASTAMSNKNGQDIAYNALKHPTQEDWHTTISVLGSYVFVPDIVCHFTSK